HSSNLNPQRQRRRASTTSKSNGGPTGPISPGRGHTMPEPEERQSNEAQFADFANQFDLQFVDAESVLIAIETALGWMDRHSKCSGKFFSKAGEMPYRSVPAEDFLVECLRRIKKAAQAVLGPTDDEAAVPADFLSAWRDLETQVGKAQKPELETTGT